MALTKSQLYSSLWESCDLLRGGMDASQYKDYVLVLLFLKYATPLPKLAAEVDILAARVDAQPEKMGFNWNVAGNTAAKQRVQRNGKR